MRVRSLSERRVFELKTLRTAGGRGLHPEVDAMPVDLARRLNEQNQPYLMLHRLGASRCSQ